MDENLEFKNIIAGVNSDGTNKAMYLMPYAKDLVYRDGQLSMVLEFVNENAETEIGIRMELDDDLVYLLDKIEYGEV